MSLEADLAKLRNTVITLQARVEVYEQTSRVHSAQLLELQSVLDKLLRSMETEREMSRMAWKEIVDSIKANLDVFRSDVSRNIEAAASRSATENTLKMDQLLRQIAVGVEDMRRRFPSATNSRNESSNSIPGASGSAGRRDGGRAVDMSI